MTSNRLRRIAKEIEETASDTFSKVQLRTAGHAEDLTHLEGQFEGPPDTPYEGGRYLIDIRIPTDYPFRPPLMRLTTRIWHPNVSSQTGAICLDTLSTNWSPVFTIKSAIISVQGLLASPEPKDPQDAEVASMLLNEPDEFYRIAREWAVKYAQAPDKKSGPNMIAEEVQQDHSLRDKHGSPKRDERCAYRGYSPDLIERFTAMGFGVTEVVAAFEFVHIDTNNGADYDLDQEEMDHVTAKLFDET